MPSVVARDERAAAGAAAGERAGRTGPAVASPAVSTNGELVQLDHAEWNRHTRGESDVQRVDRNFLELLQELRVAQTGVQILFAFLLGLAFTPRFAALTDWQHGVYLATLVCSATSAALLIAPVGYHRTVFRRRLKARLVETGHRYAVAGLVLLLLALVGGVELAASLLIGPWAALLAGVLSALFATLWFLVPLWHRATQDEPGPD
jgi:Family of unknown function (DUF6328)